MKIINIFMLIIWMGVIFALSNQDAEESTSLSSGVIKETYTTYYKAINKEVSVDKMNLFVRNSEFYVRKLAHFTEFLILGLFIINVLKDYMIIDKRIIIISIICALLYAISDEIHQLFISKRACRMIDILIDTCGSSLGVYLYYKFKTRKINS